MLNASLALFPLWIELSGLPAQLAEDHRGPAPWMLLRKIIELDMAQNRVSPGMVEISLEELGERCSLDPEKLEKHVKALRKSGLVRAFLPDNVSEPALFQILTPLPTPRPADEVRARHPDYFLECPWPPRYAIAAPAEGDAPEGEGRKLTKVQQVVELYLNALSMKLNSIILDQLQLIADRYEMELIKRVFEKARKEEATSLGWVLTEIRREEKFRQRALERKEEN